MGLVGALKVLELVPGLDATAPGVAGAGSVVDAACEADASKVGAAGPGGKEAPDRIGASLCSGVATGGTAVNVMLS